MNVRSTTRARAIVAGLVMVCSPACGGGVERAAQSARLEALEQDATELAGKVAELKTALEAKSKPPAGQAPGASAADRVFHVKCPPPFTLRAALGATMWSCRAPQAVDGVYPHCTIAQQPQIAIETKEYFEHVLDAAPQLFAVESFADKPVKVNGATAFEATFDADPKPVPLKALGVLFPHGMMTYALTCFAPRSAYAKYEPAFRHIVDSFAFVEGAPGQSSAAKP